MLTLNIRTFRVQKTETFCNILEYCTSTFKGDNAMNTALDSTPQFPGQWIRRQVLHFLGRPWDGPNQEKYRHPDSRRTEPNTEQTMVYSKHTHHDPNQVAIQDGVDAWARHAAASNGFGDL